MKQLDPIKIQRTFISFAGKSLYKDFVGSGFFDSFHFLSRIQYKLKSLVRYSLLFWLREDTFYGELWRLSLWLKAWFTVWNQSQYCARTMFQPAFLIFWITQLECGILLQSIGFKILFSLARTVDDCFINRIKMKDKHDIYTKLIVLHFNINILISGLALLLYML